MLGSEQESGGGWREKNPMVAMETQPDRRDTSSEALRTGRGGFLRREKYKLRPVNNLQLYCPTWQ